MKHDTKTLILLFGYIILVFSFCQCNQGDPVQPICDYTHEVQFNNYVWDVIVDGESLKDNPAFDFPYTTAVPGLIESDLNTWLNSDGIAAVTITSPERGFLIVVEETDKVFESVIFSGDNSGGNQVVIEFIQSC